MVTRRTKPAAKTAANTETKAAERIGTMLQNCNFEANAAPVSDEAAKALGELARASIAHAESQEAFARASAEHASALARIADALKGAPGGTGLVIKTMQE